MVYLDNAATTQPMPAVLDIYREINETCFGNAGSHHYFGVEAAKQLEAARTSILKDLKLEKTHRAVFVSGATEGNNTVFKGIGLAYANRGKKVLVSPVEHPSVLETAKSLGRVYGFDVVVLPVNSEGKVEPKTLEEYMDKQTILVSIMSVNNETGAVNDLPALAEVVHRYPKAFFHSDMTQGIGKLPMDYGCVDLLTFSGHKIGGLKGTGALIFRNNIHFEPLHSGGVQEYAFRAGTVDVPGAVSLAKALSICTKEMPVWLPRARELVSFLKEELAKNELVTINSPEGSSPYVFNFSLVKHKASVVVEALSRKGIYVSSIAACSSKGEDFSYVLAAMGKSQADAANSIRVSVSHSTRKEDLVAFLDALNEILKEVHPR